MSRAPFLSRQEDQRNVAACTGGINGTVAGSSSAIEALLEYLTADDRLADLDYKFSYHEERPFLRMKVKLKREIVTMGQSDIDPNQCVGRYASPQEWNALIDDPEVLVIDTRNKYEVEIGTFEGAVNPYTKFQKFLTDQNLDPANIEKWRCFALGYSV